MAPWLIISGFGLDDWIYWHILLHSLVNTVSYNNSQSVFSRTLVPWLPRTRSILILVLRLTAESESYVMTDGLSANLSWNKGPIWDLTRILLLSDSCRFVDVWRSLWREDGSGIYNCCWPSPAQSFSGPSAVGLAIIFYCLRFETSLFVASYDSQGYGGGIRPRLHTGLTSDLRLDYLYTREADP
jgi:hypothetical protein